MKKLRKLNRNVYHSRHQFKNIFLVLWVHQQVRFTLRHGFFRREPFWTDHEVDVRHLSSEALQSLRYLINLWASGCERNRCSSLESIWASNPFNIYWGTRLSGKTNWSSCVLSQRFKKNSCQPRRIERRTTKWPTHVWKSANRKDRKHEDIDDARESLGV